MNEPYDYLIVGSGAGGAALARELSGKGRRFLIVERGRRPEKLGTALSAGRYFDSHPITMMPARSREGVVLWRGLVLGGSTVFAPTPVRICSSICWTAPMP